MRVVAFRDYEGDEAVGYLEGNRVVDFTRAFETFCSATGFPLAVCCDSIIAMLEMGVFEVGLFQEVRSFVKEHGLEPMLTVEDPELMAPIARPPRIMAPGANYALHVVESGHATPKEPGFFIKASTAVIGPGESVVIPRGVGRVDHEVELAVIIGKSGRRITRGKAAQHIAGYTILNDVTARDMQGRAIEARKPMFTSKSMDTFGPMGPCVTLPDEIQEPCELNLKMRVNGEIRQKNNTRNLIFNVPELIHQASKYITLEPGDVISTGTPEGISEIKPGDVMEAEVERIGVLRNPVVAAK